MRVDTGVEQGDEITPHYDPMIAKLIVWDDTRSNALARMRQALRDYQVIGVSHNIEFLGRLIETRSFAQADLDTGLIEREAASLFPEQAPRRRSVADGGGRGARDAGRAARQSGDRNSPWGAFDFWRLNANGHGNIHLRSGSVMQELRVEAT